MSPTPARLLLRGGTVVDTDPQVTVRPNTDVLIEQGEILAVGSDLSADGAEVLDARDQIVLPGFVDTHRHVWQAVLRATAVDSDLGDYLNHILGRLSPAMRPEDVYAGNLLGALECLDAGITTVQDFSHVQHRAEHGEAAVGALRAAGIRAVFGFGYPPFDPDARDPKLVRDLRARLFAGDDDPVTLALAPSGPSYAPIDIVEQDWRLAAELDIPLAIHVGSGPVAQRPIEALRERGLLNPRTLYVHGNSLPDDELAMIADSGGTLSIAPAIEAQMGHGAPMINRARATGVVTGLGVDVVTTAPGDMFSLMRAALLTSQLADGPRLFAADVLRMATIGGAAALGLSDRIGSLAVGKRADLVLLRTDAVNMVGATHDIAGAVVASAHPGNVDTVLVAGRIVKRAGLLTHPDLPAALADARRSVAHLAASA
ncbi:amidohydrolase family protein [Embleya sp. NBC_00896]|uniref:amidohydrolase family protein n=1 Tax=Embleya sp. NBC_00896 TaxID=2975961 RepID=UPI002F907B5E|nr:amidohydrolase family protein [Embleya sp. NBC_00896]